MSLEMPGLGGLPLMRFLVLAARGDLLRPFVDLFERFGPLFQVRLPLGHNLVMLAHPVAVEHVLRSRQNNYIKGSV